jgi:lysophosphatidic acid phosphatase type 6
MNILSSILKKNSHSTVIKLICITGTTAVTIRHLAADSFAKSQSLNEKLVSVHLFSRHGARTPLYLVNGIEEAEYNSELLEPYVKAPYVLKDLNNRDFRSYMSHWDKLNFENKLKGGAGRGQLTTVGEKQLFELGRRVQKRYVEELKFLSPDYDPSVF